MILDKLRITLFCLKWRSRLWIDNQTKKHEVDKMVIAKNSHHRSDPLIQVPVLCPMFLDWKCEFVIISVFVEFDIILPDWYGQPNQYLLFQISTMCNLWNHWYKWNFIFHLCNGRGFYFKSISFRVRSHIIKPCC